MTLLRQLEIEWFLRLREQERITVRLGGTDDIPINRIGDEQLVSLINKLRIENFQNEEK